MRTYICENSFNLLKPRNAKEYLSFFVCFFICGEWKLYLNQVLKGFIPSKWKYFFPQVQLRWKEEWKFVETMLIRKLWNLISWKRLYLYPFVTSGSKFGHLALFPSTVHYNFGGGVFARPIRVIHLALGQHCKEPKLEAMSCDCLVLIIL